MTNQESYKTLWVQSIHKVLGSDIDVPKTNRVICIIGTDGSVNFETLSNLAESVTGVLWRHIPWKRLPEFVKFNTEPFYYWKYLRSSSVKGWGHTYTFINVVDEFLHPKIQGLVMPHLLSVLPDTKFIITTNSPFVIRSMRREDCIVVSLPDTLIFQKDFPSLTIKEILTDFFQVNPGWLNVREGGLCTLKSLLREDKPETYRTAINQLNWLKKASRSLSNESDKILDLYSSATFHEYLIEFRRNNNS